jgi:hypothetical protein
LALSFIAEAIGAESSSAVWDANVVPAFTKGVRNPGTRKTSRMILPFRPALAGSA